MRSILLLLASTWYSSITATQAVDEMELALRFNKLRTLAARIQPNRNGLLSHTLMPSGHTSDPITDVAAACLEIPVSDALLSANGMVSGRGESIIEIQS
jgi:hypothetical protein